MDIQIDNLERVEVKQFLQEHHEDMLKHSPQGSVHALDLTSLKDPSVVFWTVWINTELVKLWGVKKVE
ncbi:hypothetical protein [Colwellia maritima]|uniref:hypothetical protein n=1 Tax=Colwellia maritima TaxID=2912588 RepID=UPI00308461B0